jgi:hypothetical protein
LGRQTSKKKTPEITNDEGRDYSYIRTILYLATHPRQAIKTIRSLHYVIHGGPL